MIILGYYNKAAYYRGTTPITYTYAGDRILIDQLEVPNDEIWYTSTDGNVVNPDQTYLNATIVSNTYSGGKGIIKFSADLTQFLDGSISGRIIYGAFANITNISSIEIPNSVTRIGDQTFNHSTGLTLIEIPSSVTSIGVNAFAYCSSLTSITIPNSVTTIELAAFGYCGLTSVTIGNGVTSIGEYAFNHSTGLTSISYTGTKSQWNSITKEDSWNYYVPATVVHCTDGDVSL